MREKVEGAWADDTTVLGEVSLEAGGVTYTLVLYRAHYEHDHRADREELRYLLERGDETHGLCDFILHEPVGDSDRLLKRETLQAEAVIEHEGLEVVLVHLTDEWDPEDPEGTIANTLGVVARRPGGPGQRLYSRGAGYVREKPYVAPPPRPAPPPPVFPADAAPEPALYCEDCETFQPAGEGIPLYECSRCSQTSEERRCESCNIFMAKLTADGCPECAAAHMEEAEAVADVDGRLRAVEEWREEVKA